MNENKLTLDLLPGSFAVVQLEPTSPIPTWARGELLFSVTRTETETSILCDEIGLPPGIKAERGFRCFRVRGPLDFTEVGILQSLLKPLADAGISVFAMSTFETDYVLVSGGSVEAAVLALSEAGHIVHRHR